MQRDVFHPHPLTLKDDDDDDDDEAIFVCNGCGELCCGSSYNCSLCLFSLDMECAALNDDLAIRQAKKGRETITTIYHFTHNHQLTRCRTDRILQAENEVPACIACRQDLRERLQIQETDEARDDEQRNDEASDDEQEIDGASDDEPEIDEATDDQQEIDEDSDEDVVEELKAD
ncbi:hypothetical protein PTKIN_Ptkin01aG0353600 [Pterospermum kingtungense]